MQQTQTYKLNLVEGEDPFSPLPLNENAEKLEAAISAARADAAAGDAALDQRVTVLEAKLMVVGSYTGDLTRNRQFLFDRTPSLVLVMQESGNNDWMIAGTRQFKENMNRDVALGFIENGFQIGLEPNEKGKNYVYVAMFN